VATRRVDFRGERRSNAMHQSTTDPDARLYRKSDGRLAELASDSDSVAMSTLNQPSTRTTLILATNT
jgi:hypothetical protein